MCLRTKGEPVCVEIEIHILENVAREIILIKE
jgi:hypothetical protein